MGCFDTVVFNCPECRTDLSFQTKAGDCDLTTYALHEIPPAIADSMRRERGRCPKCKALINFQVQAIVSVEPYVDAFHDPDDDCEGSNFFDPHVAESDDD